MNNHTDPSSSLVSGGGTPAASGAGDAEDAALVEQTLQGRAEAFETLFVKHRQRVFASAWRLLRDEDAALDVVQDAFVKAYRQLESLRGDGRFLPWIRRIAVNLSLDRLRRARRGAEVSLNQNWAGEDEGRDEPVAMIADEKPGESPVEQAQFSELSGALAQALLKLSVPHRTVFMLHASEGMSYQEIAGALGCNIGTVMSRLFYARKRLQELLAPHLKDV